MVYDWNDKRDLCYRLYVQERKSLDEVVDYFKNKLDFVPSKRTFQTQFRRWGFPTKLDYSHKDEAVVQRVREMWEKNVMQKDMLLILHDEGYNVTESGLQRLRAKHNMHLKSANGVRAGTVPENVDIDESLIGEADSSLNIAPSANITDATEPFTIISRPRERTRKPKRIVEGSNSGLQGISSTPRYPSETTIGDAQQFLGLTEEMYREVREQFKSICVDRDIIKKTICGPERWEAAKGQLIQDLPYLQQHFMTTDASNHQPLTLSLDIICMDVTKNMRVQSKTMSLSEAKNVLGLNPMLARVLKTKLMDILRANNFVNTYESDNWNGVKDQWLEETHLKARIPTEEGPARERALKAVQLVCRDTLKRWREAQQREKEKSMGSLHGTSSLPPDLPVVTPITGEIPNGSTTTTSVATKQPQTARGKKAKTSAQRVAQEARIDPSLLQAATTSERRPETQTHGSYPLPGASDLSLEPPLAVYFRRSPQTGETGVPPLWLGVLSTRSLAGLHQAALNFPGGQAFNLMRIEGVIPSPNGGELLYQIDQDDEVQGYLLHSEGSKASFVVHLGARV